MDTITASPPGLGDNSGALDLALMLDADLINAALRVQYAHKLVRKDELLAGFTRFEEANKTGIANDTIQAKASDFAKQLKGEIKEVDAARETVKRPVLAAQRVIDGFFKREITEPLEGAAAKVVGRMNVYANEKLRREREAREAEFRRQQEEAARLAALAEREEDDPAAMDKAIAAEQAAMDAEAAAAAPAAAISRVTSDMGTTSSLRTKRVWVLDDLQALVRAVAAGRAPINLITINTPILDAMARDKNQADLPGLRFTEETKVAIR